MDAMTRVAAAQSIFELDRKRGDAAELDVAINQKKEHLRTLTAAVAGVEAIR